MRFSSTYIYLLCIVNLFTKTLAPAPMVVAVGVAAFTWVADKFILPRVPDSYLCYVNGECCDDSAIVRNWTALEADLSSKLYGQHLVEQQLLMHIREHFEDPAPRRPLVMSFHGSTGVGKNFVTDLIARNVFRLGRNSRFVHYLSATLHFAKPDQTHKYAELLQSWMKNNVSICPYSVFIFDEIDKMEATLLETLAPYLDYLPAIDGVDFRRSTFIFLSNLGADALNRRVLSDWQSGKLRESILYRDLEHIVLHTAYEYNPDPEFDETMADNNQDQDNKVRRGLYGSTLVSKGLISSYVPFLPLERSHVRKCARDELIRARCWNKVLADERDRVLDFVADFFEYEPPSTPQFSAKGCKSIESNVRNAIIEDQHLKSVCGR